MTHQQVEAALSDLARHIDWPADVNVAITPRPVGRRWLVWIAAAASVIIAFAALPPGREAIAGLARVVGIRIEFREPPADVAAGLSLGPVVDRATAEEAVDFELVTPAGIGPPDAFYVRRIQGGKQVWSVWKASSDLPTITGTEVGLILTQFVANPEEDSIVKLASAGIEVISVDVNGDQGYWLQGGPHVISFNNGQFAEASQSNGNVLIWSDAEITYRLEAAMELPRVLELARTMEPLG